MKSKNKYFKKKKNFHCRLPVLSANKRQVWKRLAVANTLAYYCTKLIPSLKVQAPGNGKFGGKNSFISLFRCSFGLKPV
jgi:hypothetical protein